MIRSAIFDLDGTLADTSGDLIAAANACFDNAPLDPVRDMATAFAGGRAMLRLGLARSGAGDDPARVEALFPEFLDVYARNIDRHTRLYPGVRPALEGLRDAGWRLGCCTNKPVDLARNLLVRLGMDDLFGCLLGADSLPVKKPDPRHLLETIERLGGAAARSFLLGDTVTDREAARRASVPCVLVTFGPEGNAVRQLEPDALLDHYDALGALAEDLVPA